MERRPSTTARIDPAAASAEIEDLGGSRRHLASLWEDKPVVLVFLRHFG